MKKTGKQLLEELRQREVSNISGRLSTSRSAFAARLTNYVPARYRWIIPWVQENVQLPTPNLDSIREKLPKRFRKKKGTQADGLIVATEEKPLLEIPPGVKALYPKYHCPKGNPLACDVPQQTIEQQPEAKYCSQCGFPGLLLPETKVRGNRGIYEIESFLGYRGKGRLYQAIQLQDSQPIVIKEYLLPNRYFNQSEAKARKEAFVRLASIDLADGRVQDVRLITPLEAIADPNEERCYLVTKGNLDTSPTLATYLAYNGPMTGLQVYSVLNQVLQSLEFLHDQKYLLASGLVQQGLSHGNLSLDSLLITPNFQGFFIYLCDLGLWENRFNPPLAPLPFDSPTQDLKDLGYIAFHLLAGRTIDPVTKQPLNPRDQSHWPAVKPELKTFVLNLCGVGLVSYDSAEIARKALLKLSMEREMTAPFVVPLVPEEEEKKAKRFRLRRLWIGILLGLLLLGLLIGFLIYSNRQFSPALSDPLPCCIKQVSGVPSGTYSYTSQKDSTWSYVERQDNLISLGKTFGDELQQRQPKLKLIYRPEPTTADAIAKVQSGEAQFAVTSLASNVGVDLVAKEFARDALVVFVPFSYAKRENSLPQALQGKISFDQLRQLYTGKITWWNQLDRRFPNLPVKLYIPTEDEAVAIFEQRVLQDAQSIQEFRNLIEQGKPFNQLLNRNSTITQKSTLGTLREVISGFENKEFGAISFGTISKVFGQCSVYPLDLGASNQPSVSPLIHNDGTPVTPQTDLCNDKGNYAPNLDVLMTQQYPLAYSLAVVYPRDNRRELVGQKYVEMLRTVEGQELLRKTGLLPLQLQPTTTGNNR
ncbi:MAG TPA: substrate-binding domain-containing protein [Coleofasciculaceae cyanobacterium]